MGPKRVITSKKQKTMLGSSSTPITRSFNSGKFLGPKQEDMYREMFNCNIWAERNFNINLEGNYRDYTAIIEERKWKNLTNPSTSLKYEIVHEFYANAIPIED